MITRIAQADLQTHQAADRSPWRMDPPPPTGLHDLLRGAWPGALVAMVLLGLLLAFGSVVRDGVRRSEQLRSQMAGADWRCDAVDPSASSLSCTKLTPSARVHNAEPTRALNQASLAPLPTHQQ